MTRNRYGRGSGPLWFLALVVVIYVLYSGAVAATTADDCRGGGKSWQVVPPRWECDVAHGLR